MPKAADTSPLPVARKDRCDACRFFELTSRQAGCCHRWPPVVVSSVWSLPVTTCDGWCGEFAAAKSEK